MFPKYLPRNPLPVFSAQRSGVAVAVGVSVAVEVVVGVFVGGGVGVQVGRMEMPLVSPETREERNFSTIASWVVEIFKLGQMALKNGIIKGWL